MSAVYLCTNNLFCFILDYEAPVVSEIVPPVADSIVSEATAGKTKGTSSEYLNFNN